MLPSDGPEAAKAAGLRYTTDAIPGIRRVKRGKHFTFVAADGAPIADRKEIARIKSLAVPPAYTDVWISPLPKPAPAPRVKSHFGASCQSYAALSIPVSSLRCPLLDVCASC